eukprot:6456143-Amphidinium_carterae.2
MEDEQRFDRLRAACLKTLGGHEVHSRLAALSDCVSSEDAAVLLSFAKMSCPCLSAAASDCLSSILCASCPKA